MQLLTHSEPDQGNEPVSDAELDVEVTEVSRAARVRVLLAAALGPLVTGYAAIATVLTLVALTAERTVFSAPGILLAAGPGWLAAHQVRLGIGGHPLGVLPLLPTLGVALLVVRTASGAAQRLGCRSPREAVPVLATIAGAHAVFGLVIAIFAHGSPVTAEPIVAFAVPGLLAGLAAMAGIVLKCGVPSVVRERLDPTALRGLRAGALGLAVLVLCGAVVFLVATVLSWSTVDDLFEPSFGNSFGLFLLSVLYLPNAVIAALSFTTGPGFSIGALNVGMFGYRGGAVPGLPIAGGLPEHAAPWWPALLVLPALTGALVGWTLRRIDDDPGTRIRAVAVAGALAGFGCVLLGTLAGGRLGDGPFDPVSVPVGVASVVVFCWIVVPGGFVAFFAGPHEPPAPPGTLEVDDSEVTQEIEAVVDAEEAEADEDSEAPEADEDDEAAEVEEVGEGAEGAEDVEASEEAEASVEAEAPEELDEAEAVEAAEEVDEPPAAEDDPPEPETVTGSTESPGDDSAAEADR